MKVKMSLLSLLALAALVVAACGGAVETPTAAPPTEAAMEMGDSDTMVKDGADAAMKDDSDAMVKDSPDATMKDDSDAMAKDDSDVMMKDESDAMPKDSSDVMMKDDSDAMAKDDTSMASGSDASMDKEVMVDLPAWFSVELTDVNSGETLTVADLQGKVVLVETMAIWCSNCLRQQKEVKALHEALGMEDGLVTLVLDIDPNENADNLKDYAAKHSFDWAYVVAPREVAREIGQLYGDQFLNPPSTPMLIVDRHGKVHLLPFGRKTAEDLQEALKPFLSEGM